ncbi:hypothetical protein GCM10010402_82070 [Actinomadura luteofluorescens]|uniref:hypothetical protein n=1 Tax=Actinomadura TaxID=1988 RepID=UPI0021643D16|nr:hypothetical protein [Actinomadura glauciflava]MCR3738979.1 hypothetical protein [Actinomadura glauciflava]
MTRREPVQPLDEAGALAAASGEVVVTGVTVGEDGVTRAIVGDPTTGTGRAVDLGR